MKSIKTFILLLIAVISTSSFGAEQADLCVKYEKQYGWSKGYSVKAKIIDGYDLGVAVNNFRRFKSYATYAVVFWDQGEASIFELPYGNMVPIYETEVSDQTGRKWRIKEGDLCY